METKILIAVHELRGGVAPKKGEIKQSVKLAAGAELTAEKARAMGLDRDAIADLVKRGALAEVSARLAGGDDMLPAEEGITLDEFKAFLDRHAIAYPADATVDDLLAIAPATA